MTAYRNSPLQRASLMARLLGGASLAVLATYGPAMAQAVNITIDSAQVAPASAFTAANVTGFETVANSTQDSRAAVTASIVSGVLNSDIAGSGSSAVGIEDNALTATASGNIFTFDANQLGTAGDGASGTLGILSGQFADRAVTTSITGSSLTIDGTGDATATSLAASENTIAATTTANNAAVVFSDDISADLAGDLAQSGTAFDSSGNTAITLTRGDLTDQQLLSVPGGSSVVANTQSLVGGNGVSATIDDSTISVSLAANDSINSAVTVDGNELRSTASGNIATTGTDVTVDTAFDGSAGVFTQQQITPFSLTATADDSGLSVTLGDSTGSSLTVSDNVLGASARGNVATLDGSGVSGSLADGTSLRIDANTITSDDDGGRISIANAGTLEFEDATTDAEASDFGFVAASQQTLSSGTLTASNNTNSLTVDASGALNASSLTVADNTAFALASGNTAGTAIDLTATSIAASAGLAIDQNAASASIISDLGATNPFTLNADVNGDLSDSSLAVDSNLSVAEANVNTGRTLLSADADTALLSSSTLDTGSGVIDTANATTATVADFALAANQSSTSGSVNADAVSVLDATVGDAGGGTPTGAITDSSVSLSSNVQQASAGGNTLTNGIDLDGNVIGLDAGGAFDANTAVVSALTSVQDSSFGVSADSTTTLSLSQADFSGTTAVSGSSLDVNANENRATATANRATNTLAVTADTAIIGADVNAASADFASATSITTVGGTNTLANVQESSAGLNATTITNAEIVAGGAAATTASLTGSSASISDNIATASGSANIGTSTIDIDAGTETTTNAALANVQTSSTGVDVDSTLTAGGLRGIRVTGPVTSSTLEVDNNVIVASGFGNQGTSNLSVTANTIDRTDSTATGSNVLSATVPSVDADFASLNVQNQTGGIASNATASGLINISGGTVDDSSATLNGNQLQSDATSNFATNSVDLTGASAITATTAGLGSIQTSGTGATPITIASGSTAIFGFGVQDRPVTNSTISIDGNQSFDSATSNRATNTVSLAGNSITGQAASLADVGVTLVPQVSTTALADNSLSSVQTSFAGVTSVSTVTGSVSTGGGALSGSSVSVSDNFARSFGMGNTGANTLDLMADTSFSGTAALTATQVQAGDVASSASVSAPVTVASLTDSTAAIDDNIAFSRSMGNDQTNALSIEGSSIAGVSVANDGATFAGLGDIAATSRTLDGDNVLTAFQGLVNGDVTGAATVTGSVITQGVITDSSVSASDNIAQSNVTGSRGNNLLELAADTSVTGVSVLTSEQSGRADNGETNAITSTADLTFGIGQAGAFAPINSALNVDGNVGFSSAFGNDVTNRVDVSGTSAVGQDDALATVGINATGVVSGTADNLVGNFQSRSDVDGGSNGVTSSADLTINLLNAATGATSNSTITAADNILDSTATSNRASNALVLNADTALTAGGAIANQQFSDSPVVSDVALRTTVGGGSLGDLTESSVALRDNTGIARAAGNDAVNALNASAGTVITGVAGTGSSTVGAAGVLNASGTFATASNQVNTGAVTARASFGAVGDPTQSSLGVQTAALNSSSVDLSGNRLVADAVSNRVSNTISVSGRSPSTDVSTALTSRQVASGAVTSRVDTFNVASANGALDASSARLDGNTFSASASGNVATSRILRD